MKLSLLNNGDIDQFVDICDNTRMNNQKEFKGYEMLNNPNHYHLAEQLDILEMFATWKEEAANELFFHSMVIL